MSRVTKFANGQNCQIRLFGCGWDLGVVACHYPLTDHHGMAIKAPDFMVAFGCQKCHDAVDGRRISAYESPEQIELAFLRGVLRTQAILNRAGLLEEA